MVLNDDDFSHDWARRAYYYHLPTYENLFWDSYIEKGMSLTYAGMWNTVYDIDVDKIYYGLHEDILPDEAGTPRVNKFDFAAIPVLFLGVWCPLYLYA